jgi:predicted  nucleic acid-binding Zn-ribbon protein
VDINLQNLVDLQKLDSQILALHLKIESIPAHIAAEEAVYKNAQKAHEAASQQQQSIEKKKKEKERQIEDLTEKIAKMRSRAPEIKTNKEYQANLREIEAFEAQIRAIEDELLDIMEAIENSAGLSKEENSKFAAAKAEAEALGTERQKEAKIAEQELQALKAKRKEFSDKIEPDTYALYIGLLKSKRGLAVAEVAKGICQGCCMNVPPQLFVQIKNAAAGSDLFQCPQCLRILYYIKPVDEKQEPAAKQETSV